MTGLNRFRSDYPLTLISIGSSDCHASESPHTACAFTRGPRQPLCSWVEIFWLAFRELRSIWNCAPACPRPRRCLQLSASCSYRFRRMVCTARREHTPFANTSAPKSAERFTSSALSRVIVAGECCPDLSRFADCARPQLGHSGLVACDHDHGRIWPPSVSESGNQHVFDAPINHHRAQRSCRSSILRITGPTHNKRPFTAIWNRDSRSLVRSLLRKLGLGAVNLCAVLVKRTVCL